MKDIKFVTNIDTLLEFPELHPQPARNFIPDWYKNMPIDYKLLNEYSPKLFSKNRTIKTCPSFMEVFNEGYVMVAPCDIWLRVQDNGQWEWKTAHPKFALDEHNDLQFLKHIPKSDIKKVFKFISPWYCITPKGYSVKQIPIMYDYKDTGFTVLYGNIKTDQHHEVNPQICVTVKEGEVLIKRGQPLHYLLPYKREKFKLKIDSIDKYAKIIDKQHMYVRSSFRSNYHRYED